MIFKPTEQSKKKMDSCLQDEAWDYTSLFSQGNRRIVTYMLGVFFFVVVVVLFFVVALLLFCFVFFVLLFFLFFLFLGGGGVGVCIITNLRPLKMVLRAFT